MGFKLSLICCKFGSQIHVWDFLPQYEYWPSNLIINDESVFERPWSMKYCVCVVMIYYTVLMLIREDPVTGVPFLPHFSSSCRIYIVGKPSVLFHGWDTTNDCISGKTAFLLPYHYVEV